MAALFKLHRPNGELKILRPPDKSAVAHFPVIYHLSLQAVGIIAGVLLVLISLPGLLKPNLAGAAQKFPRSHMAGVFLLTICLVWTFWLLATIQMGEFSAFRRPLLIALPIGYGLVLRLFGEFLAGLVFGVLCLLAAEPLLDAAFLRYETSRLLVTVLAYLLILAGLFWVAIPYVLRDQLNWTARGTARWRLLQGIALCYGVVILALAITVY